MDCKQTACSTEAITTERHTPRPIATYLSITPIIEYKTEYKIAAIKKEPHFHVTL